MTIHRPHPITGPWPFAAREGVEIVGRVDLIDRVPTEDSVIYDDPEDAILYDACDRCAEHADDPLAALDQHNIAALWTEMVRVERNATYRDHYRTKTEARACHRLYRIAVFIERTQPHLDPWRWPFGIGVSGSRSDGAIAVNISAPDPDAERAAGYMRGVADERGRR